MVGYVFLAECKQNGKKIIDKNLSVKFDKKYLGNNPGVILDLAKYGVDNFTVTMLRAAETVKDCEILLSAFIDENNALSDPQYYNCNITETKDEPVKKSRKKRSEE